MHFNSRPFHPSRRRPIGAPGLTLLEVMIAMFIFLVGIVGVLAAMPTAVSSATAVIFQDCAIHLAHSKFAEFRRDRIDPAVDLNPSAGGYLPNGGGTYAPGKQEPYNTDPADPYQWRDFASAPAQTYQYFDDIWKYEWRVESGLVDLGAGTVPAAPAGMFFPVNVNTANPQFPLYRVSIVIRLKHTTREMKFTQYMYAYGPLN